MIDVKTSKTYEVRIFVGTSFREGQAAYTEVMGHMADSIQSFVDEVGLCVSVDKTDYFYTKGRESGVCVRLIQYPRFPKTEEEIWKLAKTLAEELRHVAGQARVSVMDSKRTITVGDFVK